MEKKPTCTSLVESEGVYLTKPLNISNYFNNYFVNKVIKLRENMDINDNSKSNMLIQKHITNNKKCSFEFHQVDVSMVQSLLSSLPVGGSAGTDHLDSKLLKISSVHVSKPISHIFNRSLISGLFLKLWKDAQRYKSNILWS